MSGDVVGRFPDRIWASPKGEYGQGFEAIKLATWSEKREYREGYETEYVRADLITSQAAEIERLTKERDAALQAVDAFSEICVELGVERDNEAGLIAAAELKRLLAEAREALKPFAEWPIDHGPRDDEIYLGSTSGNVTYGDFRRARTLTNGGENGR